MNGVIGGGSRDRLQASMEDEDTGCKSREIQTYREEEGLTNLTAEQCSK